MRIRQFFRLASTIFLVSWALCACKPSQHSVDAGERSSVEAVRAEPVGAGGSVTATGALRRQREVALSFRISGVMTKLNADEGDMVRQGAVVATLNPTAVYARLAQAKADLAKAERDYARFAQLVRQDAISRAQFDNQKTAWDLARSAYDAARFDVDGARMVSPVSGPVLSRTAQEGEVLQGGQTVITVADDSSALLLRVPVTDRDAMRLEAGANADVRFDAREDTIIPGRVVRIGQLAGAQSGTVQIDIAIAPDQNLRSGMIATATIHLPPSVKYGPAARRQRIPSEALLAASGRFAFVFVLDPRRKTARRTKVGFAGFDGDDVLVDGLASGAMVITAGAGYLADGEHVIVADEAGKSRSP